MKFNGLETTACQQIANSDLFKSTNGEKFK